jgi:hypothetical protein
MESGRPFAASDFVNEISAGAVGVVIRHFQFPRNLVVHSFASYLRLKAIGLVPNSVNGRIEDPSLMEEDRSHNRNSQIGEPRQI